VAERRGCEARRHAIQVRPGGRRHGGAVGGRTGRPQQPVKSPTPAAQPAPARAPRTTRSERVVNGSPSSAGPITNCYNVHREAEPDDHRHRRVPEHRTAAIAAQHLRHVPGVAEVLHRHPSGKRLVHADRAAPRRPPSSPRWARVVQGTQARRDRPVHGEKLSCRRSCQNGAIQALHQVQTPTAGNSASRNAWIGEVAVGPDRT